MRYQPRGHLRLGRTPFVLAQRLAVLPGVNAGYDAVSGAFPSTVGTKQLFAGGQLVAGFGSNVGAGTTDKMTTGFVGAFPSGGVRTVFARFRRDAGGGGGLGRIFDKTNGSAGQFFMWYGSQSRLSYTIYTGSGAERNINLDAVGSTTSTGEWVSVIIVHRDVGAQQVVNAWVNSVRALNDLTLTGTLRDAPGDPLVIGNRATGSRSWDGVIECLYVWDRELSEPERQALFANPYARFAEHVDAAPVRAAPAAELTGTAVARATASAALTTAITIAGTASARASAAGNLASLAAALSGAAVAGAGATGILSTAIPMVGAAAARASAAGTLSGDAAALVGITVARTSASGTLSTSISLAGAAATRVTGWGLLAGEGAALVGAAMARASSTGELSTAIALTGAASCFVEASGYLAGAGVALSGLAVARGSAAGWLSTSISLGGAGAARASGAAALMTAIPLVGLARAWAAAGGDLSAGSKFSRAPSGSGYTPRRIEYQVRPEQGSHQPRPAQVSTGGRPPAIQENYR